MKHSLLDFIDWGTYPIKTDNSKKKKKKEREREREGDGNSGQAMLLSPGQRSPN